MKPTTAREKSKKPTAPKKKHKSPVLIHPDVSSTITTRKWGEQDVEVYTRGDGHSAYHVTLWGWLVDDVLMVASPSPTVVTKAQREHLGPDKGVVLELTCARIRW